MKQVSKKFRSLGLGVCAVALLIPASAAFAGSFTPEQEAELKTMFGQYIMDHPEEIMKSVDQYQIAQQEKQRLGAEEKLASLADYFKDNSLTIAGNPDGDVTLVEYFDYNCGYCHRAYADILKLIEEDKNLRVVFQDFPVLGTSSADMAHLSIAAHSQGKYFDFHKALMEYKGPRDESGYLKVAKDVGLDVEKLQKDAKSTVTDLALQKHMEMGRDIGIGGTPAFIIGGKFYPGYIGEEGFKRAIAEARAGLQGNSPDAAKN
ncbi:MAG: thioredoxin domain-containing protein [Alphaproteobacteria bacterium]|nr:thioredoxin domain-containing protein [Alphaproteobacteria bacterium]